MRQILILALIALHLNAEPLTLESALSKAREHYPLHKNKDLLQKAQDLELVKLNMSYIPRLKLGAKATYQSDVTTLPFSSQTLNTLAGGNLNYKPLSKDQYNANIEISQPLFDAGNLWANRSLTKAKYSTQQAELESALYSVQNSVINAYFAALLLERQINQSEIHAKELGKNLATLQARYANGVANKSDIDKLKIEILQTQNTLANLTNEREIALSTLKELVGLEQKDDIELQTPRQSLESLKSLEVENASFESRPEMRVFALKTNEITMSKNAETARFLPYIDAFFQAGYGNPALNILKSGFNSYYIAGIRLNWDFGNLYSLHQQSELRRMQILQNDAKKEEFLLNMRISLKSQIKRANNLQDKIGKDAQIITLQENLTKSAQAKLQNGVLSVNDFLSEINALNTLKLQNNYDEIELLKQIYEIYQSLNQWQKNPNE